MDSLFKPTTLFDAACAVQLVSAVVVPWYYHRSRPLPPAASRRLTIRTALNRPEVSKALVLTGAVDVTLLLAATVLSATRHNPLATTTVYAIAAVMAIVSNLFDWSATRRRARACNNTTETAAAK